MAKDEKEEKDSKEESTDLKAHPVEKAKKKARDDAHKYLDEAEGDKSNLTGTQQKAIEDQRREMELEERAPGEPARSVEQSVGTERKAGLRSAMAEPDRAKANEEAAKALEDRETTEASRGGR